MASPSRPRYRLSEVLADRGLDYDDLCEMTGSRSAIHVRKVCQGTAIASPRLRRTIALALDVPEVLLFAELPQPDDPDIQSWAREVVRADGRLPKGATKAAILRRVAEALTPMAGAAS